MYNKITENLKGQSATGGAATQCGELHGLAADTSASRPNLRERVHSALYYAEAQAAKTRAYAELAALLEKNPEVARILELIESLRLD